MLKTFLRFHLTADAFEDREVSSRNIVITDIPETAFAYSFYDQNIIKAKDGELCYGVEKNQSPIIYIDCIKLTLDNILQFINEMEQTYKTSVILTPSGELHPCYEEDKVVSRSELECKI